MRHAGFRATVLVLSIVSVSAYAQQRRAAVPGSENLLRNLPGPLDSHAAALGDRVRTPGKEKTVLSGQFLDENGKRLPVRMTLQLPGLLRIEGLKPDSRTEQALLETFTLDTAEGMLAAIKDGAAVHIIGRRVGPDPSKRQEANTAAHDVYEVSGPVRVGTAERDRLKRYYFDSETGLLTSTHYVDESVSPPMTVETRFSEWRRIEGSAYPGRIERFENGHPAFSLSVNTIAASPRQDPASFR